jgi:hypothetical protein
VNDYNIYSHTFPLAAMKRFDLERATLTPFRFISRLWKELDRDKPMAPVSARVILPIMGPIAGHKWTADEMKFCKVTVVPGGRFILTARKCSLIELWDLGHSPETTVRHMGEAAVVFGNGLDIGSAPLQVIQPGPSSRLLMLTAANSLAK